MNASNHRFSVSTAALLLLSTLHSQLSTALAQGPLTPPGPPAPTMRSLDEIEPRRPLGPLYTPGDASYHFIISQPGSYYLPARIAVSLTHGIHITAAGVTLDLNGFDIGRQAGTGGDGIRIDATAHRCCIRNGTISGFANGIRGDVARGCAFRDLAVSNCTSIGILAGEGAVLESCRVHDNAGTAGIFAQTGSTLFHCTASYNTSTYGIHVLEGCSLTNCTASHNVNRGIDAGQASSLTDCVAYNNSGAYGIFADAGSSLTNCSAHDNTNSGTRSAGIGTNTGCTIIHCAASQNTSTAASTPTTGMGFDVGGSNTIQGCTATLNRGDGINIAGDTLVRDNNCDSNGNGGDGAGIHVTSSDNRIDGNNVTDNNRGIDVDLAGNVILRNSASGNTVANYEIVANNVFGAIVDRTAPGSAAVSGNSAASSAGTTDPWANFSF